MTRTKCLYVTLRFMAQVLFVCLFRVRVSGQNYVPAGGAILASNHQSFLDPVLVALALRREIHFMAREDLFSFPIFKDLIRMLNAFSVKRDMADRAAIREALTRVRDGKLVVVFPEGTRIDHGGLGEIRDGAAFIARRASCPIVPVAIYGAHRAWPSRYRIFRPAAIRVAYAPPIYPGNMSVEELTGKVAESIGALLDRIKDRA